MLNRLSLNQRRPILGQLNAQNNEKQNNQKNLNRIKKSVKHTHLDPSLVIKPIDTANYSTNADTRFVIPVNYNSFQPIEFNTKKTSRNVPKLIKSEVPVQKQKPKSNTQQFCELYGQEIIADHEHNLICKSDFLQNHEITPSLRARMLDWMVEVTRSYKFINKTYFSSVELMDRYFTQFDQKVPVTKLHILGVTAMLIASKMQQIYPLKYSTVYEKIVHKKISKEELIQMQMQVFQTLDHKVNAWTVFDLALLKINHQIEIYDEEIKQKLQDVLSFIAKCIIYDYEIYIKFDMDALASVISKIASKICRLPLQKQFICQKQCYEGVLNSLKSFKSNFKGLNNIFKFTDESIVKLVESSLLIEKKN